MGNCYDNAVVESFFGVLKRERVNRVRYRTRDEARADLFDYIEVFYNRKRRHGYLGNVSPADFEKPLVNRIFRNCPLKPGKIKKQPNSGRPIHVRSRG